MSEKRFKGYAEKTGQHHMLIITDEIGEEYSITDDFFKSQDVLFDIVDLLNVMNDTLLKQADENHKLSNKLNEQQAEIERLKEQLSLVCKAESSSPYNSVKEVLRRQIFGLDCAAQESANAWNHYCVLSKLFEEQYGEYWDNFD